MEKINFENLPSTNTPINAETLNQMQDNIEESSVVVSKTQPTTSEKVWIKKGKNLINPKKLLHNINYDETASKFVFTENWIITDYIPVEINVDYVFSHSLGSIGGSVVLFDKDKEYLENINSETILTPFKITNENAKYIIVKMFNLNASDEAWMQLEQNSVATEYEEYIEKTIYTKNNNGVFEEFYNESINNKEDKNIITARLNADVQFTSGSTANKLVLSSDVILGNKLSLSEDGGIKIGTGISKILVSGNIKIKNDNESSSSVYNAYIYKNNTIVASGRMASVNVESTDGGAVSPMLVEVAEGDVIYLGFWKESSHLVTIGSSFFGTYLTVEAVG